MAFVSTVERKTVEVLQREQFPSPAHYQIKQSQVGRECAPFRSTSPRKVAFEQNLSKQFPGPGQYNVAKQIVKPKITAYTNPSTILIQINSTGTPEFKSVTRRFEPQKITYQPIQYAEEEKFFSVKKEKRKLAKNPVNRTLMPSASHTKPSIPTKVRGLINPENHNIIKLPTVDPGPGDYQIKTKERILSKGTIWGKDKIKRFNQSVLVNTGPGSYDVEYNAGNRRKEQTSNFKSGTVRTFFDTIMYNSCSQYIAERRKKIDFKSPAPAPGQYITQDSSFSNQQIKPTKFQFFGSKVDRFKNEEKSEQTVTNAFYVPNSIGSQRSFNHMSPSFNSSTTRAAVFLAAGEQVNNPGPGEYEDCVQPIKLKSGKKVQKFGTTAERLPQSLKQILEVNSKINESEVQLENQLLKSRFGQLDTESSMFKSKTHRICFSQAKNVTLDLEYDVSYQDVARKVERQKIHLQNLRRVRVYKPPFEVNTPRFPHYQWWNNQEQQKNADKTLQVRGKKDAKDDKIISICGKIGKQQRFHSERKGGGIPGVGNYEYNNEWKNNSFNTMFNMES